MKLSLTIAVVFAVLLHAGFLLFGGLILPKAQESHAKTQVVTLEGDPTVDKPKEQLKEPEKTEKVDKPEDPPPNADEIVKSLEAEAPQGPRLDVVSLDAISAALNGGKGGDFGEALGFYKEGVRGGKGDGRLTEATGAAFDLRDTDQKPRVVYQASPAYPSEMRGKRVEGVVEVLFVVDPAGKVTRQRVERSNNIAFEKPALDAVKQWKFEPAFKGGQRVACKMRVAVRFQAS